jgi:hypothetical protein
VYVGHLAVALAAAGTKRRVPLWLLLLAAQAPDWIQLLFSFVDADAAPLYSHSIPAVVCGALAAGLAWFVVSGNPSGASLVVAVYLTHPLLDLVTGDKVWWPGRPPLGAGLYNHPAVDFVIETGIAIAGWWIYRSVKSTRMGARGLLVLATLLICQATLDIGQEVRLLRRTSGDPNWPLGIGVP